MIVVHAEEQFHRYLTQSNERIAKHRTKIISRLDKYFTMDPEVSRCTVNVIDLKPAPCVVSNVYTYILIVYCI